MRYTLGRIRRKCCQLIMPAAHPLRPGCRRATSPSTFCGGGGLGAAAPVLLFMVRNGHPGRGVPTGINAVDDYHLKTEGPAEISMSFRGAKPRGNLLEESRKSYEVPGDCHVGLRPPRNDVEILTRSFFWRCGADTPGGVPTIQAISVPRNPFAKL